MLNLILANNNNTIFNLSKKREKSCSLILT